MSRAEKEPLHSNGHDGPHMMEEDEFHEHHAQIAARTCSDKPCLLLFLVCLGGMGYTLYWALEHGDIRRLSHGFEFEGRLCGVDEGLEGLPYVYYCLKHNGQQELALEYPICVQTCPTTDDQDIECPTYAGGAITPVPTKTYPAAHYGVSICLPTNPILKDQILGNSTILGKFEKVAHAADSVEKGWPVILGVFVGLMFFGFVYLKLMQHCAGGFVHAVLLTILLGSVGLGSYYIYRSQDQLNESIVGHEREALGGNRDIELYVGAGLLSFGVLFFIMGCCCCKKVLPVAIAVVEQACEVIFEMPAMLLQPFTEAALKAVLLVAFTLGLFQLMSAADIKAKDLQVGNFIVKGVHREFEPTDKQKGFVIFWLAACLWVHEAIVAIGLFTVTYSTVIWFYTPIHHGSTSNDHGKDIPSSLFPLIKGATYGSTSNLGSLAFGGFLCFICRGIQLFMGLIAWAGHANNQVARICLCCLACFTKTVEHLNKNAYVEIAINSTNFCASARKAWAAVVHNGGKFAVLHGAATFLKWIGIFAMTLVGAGAAHCLVKLDVYASPQSEYYLESPYAVVVATMLASFTIGMAFMTIFDQVADVLLYCFVEATKRGEAQLFAPDAMVQLLNDDHNTACC